LYKQESFRYKTSPNIPPALASSPKCTLHITFPHKKKKKISMYFSPPTRAPDSSSVSSLSFLYPYNKRLGKSKIKLSVMRFSPVSFYSFLYPYNKRLGKSKIKLSVMRFSPVSFYCVPLRLKRLPQRTLL